MPETKTTTDRHEGQHDHCDRCALVREARDIMTEAELINYIDYLSGIHDPRD